MKHYLEKFESMVKACWTKPVYTNYGGEEFSYGEVAADIEKFHILFEASGVKKGDKIAICARNNARWAVAFWSGVTYEAVVVPILAEFTPDAVMNLVHHSGSTVLFTDADIWAKLDPSKMPDLKAAITLADFTVIYNPDGSMSGCHKVLFKLFEQKFPSGFSAADVAYPHDNGKDLAVINYTSGTTSVPKGVMLRHECFTDIVEFSQANVHVELGDKVVSMLPLAHMYGLVIEMIYPTCSGGSITFLGKTPSPTLLLKAMKEVRPFMVVAVPLVLEKIYKSSLKPALHKLRGVTWIPILNSIIYKKVGRKLVESFGGNVRIFIMGGAPLNPEAEKCFRRIKIPYTVGYGMTEAAPLLAYEDPDKYVPGSCGKACHEVRIDSEDPQTIAGEIQARGTNICSGYFNNPEANAIAFTDDGWLRTGDLGIIDSKGNIFIKGRNKSMILSANGQNIYPEEVEAVLNNQPYVAESVVVDRASKLVALVYLDATAIRNAGLDAEAVSDIPETVRVSSNKVLPSYSQITKVEVVLEPFAKTPKMSIKRFLYK